MKIRIDKIFTGNIRKCTKYENHIDFSFGLLGVFNTALGHIEEDDEPYQDNVTLIKVANNGYVKLENYDSIIKRMKIHHMIGKNGGFVYGGPIMSTSASFINDIFVDQHSLKNIDIDDPTSHISIKQLKKQISKN